MILGKSVPAFLRVGLDSESLEMTVGPWSGICVCVCEWGGRRPGAEPTRKCQGPSRLSFCSLPLPEVSSVSFLFFSFGCAGSPLWGTGSSSTFL